uniref:Inter-alpha-trypsin inhibitor heavy chain H3-like n=1 Tax=Diabrotica virgifera virgifera TaxID=50390 RepID=A0A6P7FMS6_DIAVI
MVTMLRLQKSYFCVVVCLILFIGQSFAYEYVVFRDGTASRPSIVKRNTESDPPRIKEFLVTTNVSNHFAVTSVVSNVENADRNAKQTAFSVVLPDRAFISGFSMEIDGIQYKAFVKEKEIAKKIYDESVATGQSAGHVAVSTKNSNRFTVTVNVEPLSKVIFKLEYEELLQRENGQYQIISNIQPGQMVKKLKVMVIIRENQPLAFLNTPYLQAGSSSMELAQTTIDPDARVYKKINSALIIFEPNIERQVEFACNGLGNTEYNGFAGQFIVNYDVNRTNEGGEVLYQDNFFFISFAPHSLDPIPKHIVFILDTSGSMYGFKISQLKDAMSKILPQLNEDDVFTVLQFEDYVFDWDEYKNKNDVFGHADPENLPYGNLADRFQSYTPSIIQATKKNIATMTDVINDFYDSGGTNSIGALEVGLMAVSKTRQLYPDKYLPIMVFLTDGMPNTGVRDTTVITEMITKLNKASYNVPIYSLSFGEEPDIDRKFLQDLSGLDAKEYQITVDLNSSIYIQNFYKTISVPLLTNVGVKNLPTSAEVTQINFPIFFNGSELVIAGKGISGKNSPPITISATSKKGPMDFEAEIGIPMVKLERIWAYLTVKQLADQYHVTGNTTLAKIGLEIAMNYSLVTDFTSLVVVKPNTPNETVNIEDAYKGIIPRKPSELPMCSNITGYIIEEFSTPEPEPEPTETPFNPDDLLEVDSGFLVVEPIIEEITTTTITTTLTTTITTTTPTTTTRELTCHESTYGCCHDGVTFALRPNFDGCDPIPKAESCSLRQDSGNCANSTFKWFYSTLRHQCRQFRYGGCGGNDNRFASKETCEETCVNPTGPERCKLPISLGGCNHRLLHWFYDQSQQTCVKYMYGGCLGNSNRFESKEECLKLCNLNTYTENLNDACFKPKDKGHSHCRRFEINYYFDQSIGLCRKFWFTGCGGNDNRFKTKALCENFCVRSKHEAMCFAPPDRGTCSNLNQAWFYDPRSAICQPFVYSGCGGNENRFDSKDDCENACIVG